jgi:hypothetical protein
MSVNSRADATPRLGALQWAAPPLLGALPPATIAAFRLLVLAGLDALAGVER